MRHLDLEGQRDALVRLDAERQDVGRHSLTRPAREHQARRLANLIAISVTRCGMRFPERRKNGTPCHRQLSISSRSARYVGVGRVRRDAGLVAIPGHARSTDHAGNVLAGDRILIRRRTGDGTNRVSTLIFSVRTASARNATGGSMAVSASNSSR